MHLLTDQRHAPAIAEWMGGRLGVTFCPPYTVLGILDASERLVGAALFNDFTGHNVELSLYGPGAFRRGIIRALAYYAFNQLGVARVTIHARKSNRTVRKLAHRVGFVYEATLKDWYGNEDGLQWRMLRGQCRWIEEQK